MHVLRSLWWKLALSYVVVTLAVVITAMLVLGPVLGEQSFKEALRPAVLELPIKRAARLLQGRTSDAAFCKHVLADLVMDMKGADTHAAAVQENLPAPAGLSALKHAGPKLSVAIYGDAGSMLHALQNPALPLSTTWSTVDALAGQGVADEVQLILPIDPQQRLVVRFYARYSFWRQFGETDKEMVFSMLFQSLFYVLPGAIFGAIISFWLTRRLKRFSAVAQTWAAGDFTQRLQDGGQDELSQHADLLDRMAEDLSMHMRLQQQLSTAEAHNHLARELHDSVKQQCFGVSLQLHAAQSWLERDPVKAAQVLAQAQSLNQNVQSELVSILQRLKHASAPAPNIGKSLQELASHWTDQIEIELRVDESLELPIRTTHELVRIASEALANVVRHAHASRCKVVLMQTADRFELLIQDNGCGFDPEHIKSGLGLHSMRERANSLPGGNMEISSSSKGCVLSIGWNLVELQQPIKGN